MLDLYNKLQKLHSGGKSIKVAIAGLGQMGSSLVSQIRSLKGMDVLAIANRDINRAVDVAMRLGIKEEKILLVEVDNRLINENKTIDSIKIKDSVDSKAKSKFEKAAKSGKVIVIDDLSVLFEIDRIDVVVDTTGSPEAGAYIAFNSINNGKHIITLNVEADTTVGPLLKRMADSAGVVYTVSAGDEPAALKELYDFASILNLEVIAAGKGKNNPLDRTADPTTLGAYSKSKGTSPKMMTSFVDGTKSMIEMACFSNATGMVPDCRGMHGPKVNVCDLSKVFSLKKDGGILDKKGVVDFAIGDVAPGVFLIYTSDQKIIRDELKYLLFGDGPNYLLYRPYHLTSIEAPMSIAGAYFYGEPTIVPSDGLISEVVTVTKRDLRCGEVLDGIGGYTVYGLIELYSAAKKERFLPIGLSEGCTLRRNIKKGKIIKYEDVNMVEDSMILKLRRLQDNLI